MVEQVKGSKGETNNFFEVIFFELKYLPSQQGEKHKFEILTSLRWVHTWC